MSSCQFNQDNFPFDTQDCYLDFRSTAYTAAQLQLKKHLNGYNIELINPAEFDLDQVNVTEYEMEIKPQFLINADDNETLIESRSNMTFVRVNIRMKRKVLYYLNKIILPYSFFYLVITFTYLLPVECEF